MPDLVLLDPCAPGAPEPMTWLQRLLDAHPELPVLVATATATPECMRRARELGARGFLTKSSTAEDFMRAISVVLAGGTSFPKGAAARTQPDVAIDVTALVGSLSRQQFRVLRLLGEGLLNKQIAYGLGIGETTVKAHISAILKKLGASNRTQAAMMVSRIALPEWPRTGAHRLPAETAAAHGRSI
jgi:DNA-binding NarL/FixJ family response regulator